MIGVNRIHVTFLITMLLTALLVGTSAFAQGVKRSIENITGDVYRFKNNFHYSVFVVTDDGIIVTDPINRDAAEWLKNELAERFDKPITHMIYSHHHGDHTSGGEVFDDVVDVIAHRNFIPHFEKENLQTAKPDRTFADTMTLELGGKRLELVWLGEGHADDLIAVVIYPERVAFIVDAVSPERLPWRDFPNTDIEGLIGQIKVIESLDFDILAPGHSRIGDKQDATNTRVYVETLRDRVSAALKDNQSVTDIEQNVTMDEYASWGSYDQFRTMNIAGMVRWLQETGQAN